MKILENDKKRIVRSKDYNTVFDKTTGYFMRWGKTKKDDPQRAHMPEIADIEISSGKCHNSCPFCYKSNTANGELHNMTFAEFQDIFHKLAKTTVRTVMKSGNVYEEKFDYWFGHYDTNIETDNWRNSIKCKQDIIDRAREISIDSASLIEKFEVYNKGLLNQIAFGITSPTDNPDFFRMMEYAREFDVIPNYTINGQDMTPDIADKTVKLCGACAISVCSDLEKSYKAVKMLSERGMKQINFHVVAMDSTFELIKRIMKDIKEETLKGLNAIVLLKYKPKGTNAGKFKPLTKEQYKEIFEYARENKIGIGFDSCSAPVYLNIIKDLEKAEQLAMYAEPCESTLFSVYINSYGECFPCSFSENECKNEENWKIGLNVLTCDNFLEIWENPRIQSFRKKLLENKRHCPMFSLEE